MPTDLDLDELRREYPPAREVTMLYEIFSGILDRLERAEQELAKLRHERRTIKAETPKPADHDLLKAAKKGRDALYAHGPCINNNCPTCRRAVQDLRFAIFKNEETP